MHRLLPSIENVRLVLRLDRPEAARTTEVLLRSLPMPVDPHGAEIAGRHPFRHAPFAEPVEVGAEVGALPPGTFLFSPGRQVLGLLRRPLQAERAPASLLGRLEGPSEPAAAPGDRLRRVQGSRPFRDRLDGAPPPPAEPPTPPVPGALAATRRTRRAALPAEIDAALGRRGLLPAEPLPVVEAEARELQEELGALPPEAEADPGSAARGGGLLLAQAERRLADLDGLADAAGLLEAGWRALGELPGATGAIPEEVAPIAGRLVGWLDERFPQEAIAAAVVEAAEAWPDGGTRPC